MACRGRQTGERELGKEAKAGGREIREEGDWKSLEQSKRKRKKGEVLRRGQESCAREETSSW